MLGQFLIALGSGIAIAALGAIVSLLWSLKGLTEAQNGSLARIFTEFDQHRGEDRQDFGRVHERLDVLTKDPLLGR